MNPATRLALELVIAATGLVFVAMGWSRLRRWRRKDPAELERLRRLEVNRLGRITAGKVVDWIESAKGEAVARLILYKYEVAGVTYEAAQDVSAAFPDRTAPQILSGVTASVKYDPKKPTNSIIACEEWSGLPEEKSKPGAGDSGLAPQGPAMEETKRQS